jgi:hypothetical protein
METLRSSADIQDHRGALKARLVTDGYLYLPRYFPSERVAVVREPVTRSLYESRWLAEPGSMRAGSPRTQPFDAVYAKVQEIEPFHRLAHDDRLVRLMRAMLDGEVFCHPAKACRLGLPTPPEADYSTRAHQDFVTLHTSADVLTAWVALTPCGPDRQGLRILRDSHRNGFIPTDPGLGGARPLYLPIPVDDARWMTADYEPGDVVIFHSLTVHGGGPNHSADIRLSVDFRYQRRGEAMRPEFARPHGWPNVPDWDRICRDWTSRKWIEVPDDVEIVPMPGDLSFTDYLATLSAPPSRLFNE